ncbi:MAG: alpha/beta hydrolase, partial [Mycobacterium sp.]
IAGDRDTLVPPELSRRLYDAAGEPKRFLLVPDSDHNSLELLVGPKMIDATVRFFRDHGVLAG